MKEFTEDLRYDYPLTPKSFVVDAGGYEGNFADRIYHKYGCQIAVFEPIPQFMAKIAERTKGYGPSILLLDYALGAENGRAVFKIKGDMTGPYADQGESIEVTVLGVDTLFNEAIDFIDLLKLNIEGGEFSVLEALLDRDLVKKIGNIQVQFHGCIPDAAARRDKIRERLAATHHLTYDAPFVWENWELTK